LKQGSRDGTARAHVVGEAEVAGHRRPFEQDVTIELQSE
jgi:hypothetical protein